MRARKYKRSRVAHKVFLVICEGETEERYVEILKRHYRLPIIIKTRVSGNHITDRLVRQYIKEMELDSESDCQVFYIYDADDRVIVSRLHSLSGKVILSNPCMELWYLLHVSDFKKIVDSDAMVRVLKTSHPVWYSYKKGELKDDQLKFLIEHQVVAIRRAKTLPSEANPSSNMYEFIEVLENEKR